MLASGSVIVFCDSDQSCWRRRESSCGPNQDLRGVRKTIAGSDQCIAGADQSIRGSVQSSCRSIVSLSRAIMYSMEQEMTFTGAPTSFVGSGKCFPRVIGAGSA
jgi:hypothetical protein